MLLSKSLKRGALRDEALSMVLHHVAKQDQDVIDGGRVEDESDRFVCCCRLLGSRSWSYVVREGFQTLKPSSCEVRFVVMTQLSPSLERVAIRVQRSAGVLPESRALAEL